MGFFTLPQGLNSMFEVYLVGNNSHHFIISPTSVQGKADIRIRVAIPLDYETVDRYDFDVSPLQHILGLPGEVEREAGEGRVRSPKVLPPSAPHLPRVLSQRSNRDGRGEILKEGKDMSGNMGLIHQTHLWCPCGPWSPVPSTPPSLKKALQKDSLNTASMGLDSSRYSGLDPA